MTGIILAILLLVLVGVIGLGIARALFQTWVDHRVRLLLLENLERNPDAPASGREMLENLDRLVDRRRHDYALTGVFLAGIGLACTGYGRFVGLGRLAVGMYVGGMICVALGVSLALLGLFVQYLGSGTRVRPE